MQKKDRSGFAEAEAAEIRRTACTQVSGVYRELHLGARIDGSAGLASEPGYIDHLETRLLKLPVTQASTSTNRIDAGTYSSDGPEPGGLILLINHCT